MRAWDGVFHPVCIQAQSCDWLKCLDIRTWNHSVAKKGLPRRQSYEHSSSPSISSLFVSLICLPHCWPAQAKRRWSWVHCATEFRSSDLQSALAQPSVCLCSQETSQLEVNITQKWATGYSWLCDGVWHQSWGGKSQQDMKESIIDTLTTSAWVAAWCLSNFIYHHIIV